MKRENIKSRVYYMNVSTGSVDTGENWLADFRAEAAREGCSWEDWGGHKLTPVSPLGATKEGKVHFVSWLTENLSEDILVDMFSAWISQAVDRATQREDLSYELETHLSVRNCPIQYSFSPEHLEWEEVED